MEYQNNERRTKILEDYFLDPEMNNAQLLSDYVGNIVENIKGMDSTHLRLERVDKETYESRLVKAEIPEKMGDTKEIIDEISYYMQGLIKWSSPGVMINVNPPSLLLPIAATACSSMFSPNLAMDIPSGNLAFAELEVVKMLSELVNWDWKKSGGVFTFGGLGTVLYAIRSGINKCMPHAKYSGVGNDITVFSTTQGHPCHYENCEWLGVGRDNCLRIPVLDNGQIDLDIFEKEMRRSIENGKKIGCIVLNGGTTLYSTIDPIGKVVDLRDRLQHEYNLEYKPHIHIDSVIGWAWLFFSKYDFEKNDFKFSSSAIKALSNVHKSIMEIEKADSFGVDFHKTGFTPYLSSVFIAKDKSMLHSLGDAKQPEVADMEFGTYAPFTYTLESSRPASSALSALVSLKQFGYEGYQRVIGTLVEAGCDMREHFDSTKFSKCANTHAEGFVSLAMLYPKELREKLNEPLDMMSNEELLLLAEYNHKFYLYMLMKQSEKDISFALDYVSGHSEVNSVKIGVIKMYPMSPQCDRVFLKNFYVEFEALIHRFDNEWRHMDLKDTPYRPKPFVVR